LNPRKGAKELQRAEIYIIFNISVTLYIGALRKCSRKIFYLKKFLLACGNIRHRTQADKKALYPFLGARRENKIYLDKS
jgi:hypothetical protein